MTRIADITSPTARSRLRPHRRHWRSIEPGSLCLGYYRGLFCGRWLLRSYLGRGTQQYTVKTFATADDSEPADGEEIMSFAQAQQRAIALHREWRRLRRMERAAQRADAIGAGVRVSVDVTVTPLPS
jgi:hypothetical protein